MPSIERRSHIRKYIRMSCQVILSNGSTIFGYTSNVCLEGIAVETSMNLHKMDRVIQVGDSGILVISYSKNRQEEHMRIRCQVRHLVGSGFGLSIRFYELTREEQDILGEIIVVGKAII